MAWDDGLVGVARIVPPDGRTPPRVVAGPGTGKTFAMNRRDARLLEEGENVEPLIDVLNVGSGDSHSREIKR